MTKTTNLVFDIEKLFAQQDSDFALINRNLFKYKETAPILYEYGYSFDEDACRKIIIEGAEFNLIYVCSRALRHNLDLLYRLNLKNFQARQFYEYDPHPSSTYIMYISEDTYNRLPPDVQKTTKRAPFFNYFEQTSKGKSISVYLQSRNGSSRKFSIIPNFAPFCDDHFVVFPENCGFSGPKQVFQNDILNWIDALSLQINNNYRIFFSPIGAGNSVDTLHFQLLKSSFPAFDALDRSYADNSSGLIFTTKNDWPFEGILARYNSDTRDTVLPDLKLRIEHWISNSENTFNLLFQVKKNGFREFFFIFRKKGFNYISGIRNEIAGYEVAGNIIVENKDDFENFPAEISRLDLREAA